MSALQAVQALITRRAAHHLRTPKQRAAALALLLGFISVLAYLMGGEQLLLPVAVCLPALGIYVLQSHQPKTPTHLAYDGMTGLSSAAYLKDTGQSWLESLPINNRKTACFLISIDGFDRLQAKYGDEACQSLQRTIATRILRGLRDNDILCRTGLGEFTFLLNPVRHLDLEICVQLASRLKAGIEASVPCGGGTLHVTATIGFCRSDQVDKADFATLHTATRAALNDARKNGNGTMRAFSTSVQRRSTSQETLLTDAAKALANNQITAWFQPQINSITGQITGFEALARWEHPKQGIISPAGFIDTLAETGQLEKLAEVMLKQALRAQNKWRSRGFDIPQVGVNFAGDELRNPMLVDKIQWELDRFNVPPERIAIEVLETVIADAADGVISRNVNGLAKLGCYIDLDDFGTGHSSISSIRRFSVSRLKIDRSFVQNVDQDEEQQRLVSAIVTMAERLGLETLAEGVETPEEQAMLTQIGCSHVQGYGIARPMPFEETIPWMIQYFENQRAPTKIERHNKG